MNRSPFKFLSTWKCVGSRERGLTMLEMVIALSIVVIMISSMVSMSNSDRQRADTILGRVAEVNAGLQRFKHDFPCFPVKLSGLVIPADSVNSTCVKPNNATKWQGPYVQSTSSILTADGSFDLARLQDGLSLKLTVDNVGKNYVLELLGLTPDLASTLLQQCGGKCNVLAPATPTTFGFLVSPLEVITPVADYEVKSVVADY